MATDVDGLTTGPSILQRQTQYNEIENDLEVFELSVYDSDNSVPRLVIGPAKNWPYRLSENNMLSVNGQIRFEGITDANFARSDAEVEIRLAAIPPSNISGGIDEWLDGEINWNYSWFTGGRVRRNILSGDFYPRLERFALQH